MNPALGTFSAEYVAANIYHALDYAILTEAVVYRDLAGNLHRACVGMPFDGLTIPRFFWRVSGPPLRHPRLPAGAIHDDICLKALALPPGPARDAERLRGDTLFREMAEALGAGRFERWYLYRSVRIGAASTADDEQIPHYIEEYDAFMEWYRKQGSKGR